MAHRTNITQVLTQIKSDNPSEVVIDPVCGTRLERKTVKFMLFRPDQTYYFCSKDCQMNFGRTPQKTTKQRFAA